MSNRKFICKFQEKDNRDYSFRAEKNSDNTETYYLKNPSDTEINTSISEIVSTSPNFYQLSNLSDILDQGNIGSCVPNAFAFCISLKTNKTLNMSRLYHYVNSRILDSSPLNKDAGTTVRTACKAIKNYGTVLESSYPYNPNIFVKFPPLSIYKSAILFNNFSYTFVKQDLISIKNCLNTFKSPIIFALLVFDSFLRPQVANTGMVPMPNIKKDRLLGGHCMNIVGYNDESRRFRCINSWGRGWGKDGMCMLPYNYLLNPRLAADFCFLQFTD